MELHEVPFEDVKPIDGYGPGFFRIAGTVHEGAQILLPDTVAGWAGYDDVGALTALAGRIDVLLIGTGAEMAYLPRALRQALDAAGVAVEPMATPQACRTYNVLLGEGRRVGAALLPV